VLGYLGKSFYKTLVILCRSKETSDVRDIPSISQFNTFLTLLGFTDMPPSGMM
jgi:hypothetical protein